MRKRSLRRLRNLLLTTVAWISAMLIFAMVRLYGVEEESSFELATSQREVIQHILYLGLMVGLVLGLVFGVLDTFKFLLRKQSYLSIILIRSSIHILVSLLIVAIYIVSYHAIRGETIEGRVLELLQESPFQKTALVLILYTGAISILFNLIRQMNVMFGPGILYKLIIGKYHEPQEEERIFMFLDLKSSTTYAERLGHVLYSELIQDCFYDLTYTIYQHQAEIYQYVGDEAVLTWKPVEGLKAANCIRAFFTFDESIQKRADYYFNKYDLVPAFKAGLNLGLVMVAEVGEVKKEIAYHSDVLNTAARIQGQCNEFGKQVLISEALKNKLGTLPDFQLDQVGTVELKGKKQQVTIFCVEPTVQPERKFEFSE